MSWNLDANLGRANLEHFCLRMKHAAHNRFKDGSGAFHFSFLSVIVSSLRLRILALVSLTLVMVLMMVTYPMSNAQDVFSWSKRVGSAAKASPHKPNVDIFEYSAMDPNDVYERDKIKQLLDDSIDGGRRYINRWHESRHGRAFKFERALSHHEIEDPYERRLVLRRYRDRWPLDLSSPRYAPYMSQFRQLLQSWARSKRYEPQIMKGLLSTIKRPIDIYSNVDSQAMGKPYSSCAVVGNSGMLLNRSFGSLIDRHDMVMRLNNAKVFGFEKWVGSKTSISFLNSNILHTCARRLRCVCDPYNASVPVVLYVCQVAHLMDVAYCGGNQKAPLLVTDPRLDSLCTRIVRYYSLKHFFESGDGDGKRSYEEWNRIHDGSLFHYSSGMQAVMIALGICESVDIFGFGKLSDAKHHYHTNQKKELALHDYEAEYIFYQDLVTISSSSSPSVVVIPFLNDSGIHIPRVRVFL